MKPQVIIGPTGMIAIAIPLFQMDQIDTNLMADVDSSYSVVSVVGFNNRPLGYALDIGSGNLTLLSAKYLEEVSGAEFLGDL